MAKTIYWINTLKTQNQKNNYKVGKALHRLMNNTEYGKTTEKLRNRTDVGLESNKKGFVKRISKPSSMTKKYFKTVGL